MRELLVMRHAKSDWSADYGADHDRPLNERGVRSARIMGRLIAAQDLVPEVIISSTAVRARTTAELAAEAGTWGTPVQLDASLYATGVSTALEVLAAATVSDRLMLVGHQPTWSGLVADLTGVRIDMKTATVAVVNLVTHTLVDVIQPRSHFGGGFDH